MLKVFCTACKPEHQVVPERQALATSCPCGNVSCNWHIDFGNLETEDVAARQPFRINSFDSRRYRVERDGVDITGQGKMIPFPDDSETDEDADEE